MNGLKAGMKYIGPSEDLRVAVTFRRPRRLLGPIRSGIPLTLENVKDFVPEKMKMDQGIDKLRNLGFELTGRGQLTASMKCPRKTFQKVFGTILKKKKIRTRIGGKNAVYSFYAPSQRKPWRRILKGLIDDVYIQWPHLYPPRKPTEKSKKTPLPLREAGKARAKPPKVDYYHLDVPNDVASLLNAKKVHRAGTKGRDIRVVMIDSGFEHNHPFFRHHRYRSKVILAGDATDETTDGFGHGTGQSANIFSVAPRVEFIGVKIGTDTVEGVFRVEPASLLEGFYKAREQNPDIISISLGHNLQYERSKRQRAKLPNSLKALEAEILHAIASGITVVVSAGNGDFSFPGMMPDVISVGGVFVDQGGYKQASDLASAFDSKIYSGRHVPDFCGLVGMKPQGKPTMARGKSNMPLDNYIMLPVPAGCLIDMGLSALRDGTNSGDGWAPFAGTSAAAPQIAGVCALLKVKNRNLTPMQIKEILQKTAIKVLEGKSNPTSSDGGKTPQKGISATGAGLVDAYTAWQQA